MEMALLLLLFGGSWVQVISMEAHSLGSTSARGAFANISDSTVTSNSSMIMDPQKVGSPGDLSSTPASSASFIASENLGTASPEPGSATFQEVSTKQPSIVPEISNTTNDSAVPGTMISLGTHTETSETMTSGALEKFNGTSGPPVTITTSSLETSNVTGGPFVTMATTSLETSKGRSGPPVTMAPTSLETSSATGGPLVSMATTSLETSSVTGGPSATMATTSLETSSATGRPLVSMATTSLEIFSGRSGPPVTMTTSHPETRTSSSPVSGIEVPAMATSEASMDSTTSGSLSSDQGMNGSLLVAVLVALLVVGVLVALLLLWRQRQKRRTGALTLNRAGKRNGVVDAWAGPAHIPDEEAVIATGGEPGGDKGSGVPPAEGTGRRPTLTTFFGRRKSHRDSVALEELQAGSAPSPKGEEEPLVGREDEASDGPEIGDGNALQSL
ncbi:leukosialin [Tamandua tetradactyla]|uniref:leukosialin n=1 Tax=Tamandua tetradactyla TaxID=48850 RepID=UPI0040546E4D